MSKPTLGIVSSYSDFCGNASYTRALVKGLAEHFEVSVISLNVELLRKGNSRIVSHYLNEVCDQLKTFEYVNIQFEAALFWGGMWTVKKRLFKLLKACKKPLLTMHRLQIKEKLPTVSWLARAVLKRDLKTYLHMLRKSLANNAVAPLYAGIVKFCKKRRIPILVHTPRDRELIEIKFHYKKVFDHPLCFYTQKYIESIGQSYTRKEFCEQFGLDEEKIHIGIFGFLSKYKGHKTAIEALQFLPDKYELLIFGAQHPHTILDEESISKEVAELVELVKKTNLTQRVKFYRPLNDEGFLKGILRCDFNVLPYLEVKQAGSAVAALSLETNSKTIFSQNRAFFELEKYAPGAFKMFTIGNYLELANSILTYKKDDYASNLKSYHQKYNISSSAALYKKLLME